MTAPASDTAGPRASAPRDDLLASPAFLALCAAWERDGRASEAGADWLRERGYEGEADGWEWAAREPDRPTYDKDPNETRGGICPMLGTWDDGTVCRWYFPVRRPCRDRDDLPPDLDPGKLSVDFTTFPAAILWFLSRWAVVRAADGGTP